MLNTTYIIGEHLLYLYLHGVGVIQDLKELPPVFPSKVGTLPLGVTLPGITEELVKLGHRGVIVPTELEYESFISPSSPLQNHIAPTLNCYTRYVHFKMESLGDVLNIMQPDEWIGSVDLQDVYYTIPIHHTHQKYCQIAIAQGIYALELLKNPFSCL